MANFRMDGLQNYILASVQCFSMLRTSLLCVGSINRVITLQPLFLLYFMIHSVSALKLQLDK